MNEEVEVEEAWTSENVPIAEAIAQAQDALDAAEIALYWCDGDDCDWAGDEPIREVDGALPPSERGPGILRCPACGSLAIVEQKTADAPADGRCWCGLTHPAGVTHAPLEDAPPPVEATPPTQAELFPPPPAPPFDFEKAYEDLARADQRARLKKGVWESCKRDTKEAREEYDEALEALHTAFQRVDTEKRIAERAQEFKQPVLVPVADAAPATESAEGETKPPEGETTEGGENEVSDLEETIDEQPEEKTEELPVTEPTTETDAPSD